MSRILAIDYGRKRTGIAVTDPLQLIANGLATVETNQLLSFIENYVKSEAVECIVFGQPKQLSGEDSENASRVRAFMEKLSKLMPEMKLVSYDERFTSVLAHRAMLMGGMKKMDRRNKAKVDEISATIILQSYMESKKYY